MIPNGYLSLPDAIEKIVGTLNPELQAAVAHDAVGRNLATLARGHALAMQGPSLTPNERGDLDLMLRLENELSEVRATAREKLRKWLETRVIIAEAVMADGQRQEISSNAWLTRNGLAALSGGDLEWNCRDRGCTLTGKPCVATVALERARGGSAVPEASAVRHAHARKSASVVDAAFWRLCNCISWIAHGDPDHPLLSPGSTPEEDALGIIEARAVAPPDELVLADDRLPRQADYRTQVSDILLRAEGGDAGAQDLLAVAWMRRANRAKEDDAERRFIEACRSGRVKLTGHHAGEDDEIGKPPRSDRSDISPVSLIGEVTIRSGILAPSDSWLLVRAHSHGPRPNFWWDVRASSSEIRSVFGRRAEEFPSMIAQPDQSMVPDTNDSKKTSPRSVATMNRTGAAGRPTSRDHAIVEMRARHDRGEMQNTLKAEAEALLKFLQQAFPGDRHAKVKALGDSIRSEYRQLRTPPRAAEN